MTQQLGRGVPLGCADVDYAAAQGLIDPVEVRWLSAAGVKCPNEQYEVMLALGTKGQLACADVEWNAVNGLINYNQAAGLLWRVPGCKLTKYAFLVALAAQGAVGCADVDWHANVGLISPTQAGWLKAALAAQGRFCGTPFSDGTRLVGTQITPGRYVTWGQSLCYWERLKGVSGSFSDIISNGLGNPGQTIVDIAPTDVAFHAERCGTWSPYGAAGVRTSFGPGDWVVGGQIAAGRYQSSATASDCYWARLSGFSGSFAQLTSNYLGTSPTIVDILPSDQGFTSDGCGSWTRIA